MWWTVQILASLWTVLFCKNRKKTIRRFPIFLRFLAFWPFKWPQKLDLTSSAQQNLGVPDLFDFIKNFVWPLLLSQKCLLKYFFDFFAFLLQQNFAKLSKLCRIPPQTFWAESVLVSSRSCTWRCPPSHSGPPPPLAYFQGEEQHRAPLW